MTDEVKTQRALAVCDEFAAQWAEEVKLTEMVAAIANKDDAEGRIIALAKQSFIEGMYRAVTEQQDQAVVMTDEAKRLAEIRERAEKATEGPWRMRPKTYDDWGYIRSPDDSFVAVARSGSFQSDLDLDEHRRNKTDPTQHNMEFIAHARADIPFLLAEIERLTASREAAIRDAGIVLDSYVEENRHLTAAAAERDEAVAEIERLTVDRQQILASIDNQAASSVNGLKAKLAEADVNIADLTAARDAAYADGAKDMREKCAEIAAQYADCEMENYAEQIHDEIRSLPFDKVGCDE